MNFAVPFHTKFKFLDDNVEFNINYAAKVPQLIKFIEKYRTHRINLFIKELNEDKDFPIFLALLEKYTDVQLIFCFPYYFDSLEEKLNNMGIPHYYKEYVTTWDQFQGFLQLNVTDIFLGDEILFNISTLSTLAKKQNKNLRCYCNVSQSSWAHTKPIKTFFIRPEDIDLYKTYIDTFEFYVNDKDYNKLNILYTIYAKDKAWYGRLNEIIVGFSTDEDSRYISPPFGYERLNCGHRCMQYDTQPCAICDHIIELSKALFHNDIMIGWKKSD